MQWEEGFSNATIARLNFPSNGNGWFCKAGATNSLGDVHLLVAARKAEGGAGDFSIGCGAISKNWVLPEQVCLEREVGIKWQKLGAIQGGFDR